MIRVMIALATLFGAATAATAQRRPASWEETFRSASNLVLPQSRAFALRHGVPAVTIEAVKAQVKLLDQSARTELEVDLHNPGGAIAESVLLLPVPDGAVVSGFSFEGPAPEPAVEILPRDEARRIYDSIVAKIRDPALLEFAGWNLLRSSVFPVPAGGHQRIRVVYEHLLTAEGPRLDYVLPRSEALDGGVPWKIDVSITSKHPVSMVYSPSHNLDLRRLDRGRLLASTRVEESTAPGEFRLSVLLERDGLSASLFAYPDPTVGGGYFLLLAGLPGERKHAPPPRELTIVLDRSGSMAGPKMDQVKAAALQVIEGLDKGEAFNIIDYSTTVESFAAAPVAVERDQILRAREYLASLRPNGGTNLHDALLEALRQPPRDGTLPIVLFLTDGLPTVGKTSENVIRQLAEKGNAYGRRIFTFGVGADVNVPLLDRVAELSRATSSFVLPGADVELEVARVFRRLSGPVLTGPALAAFGPSGGEDTTRIRELAPPTLPDLFDGDQVIVLGQYRGEDPLSLELTGTEGQALRRFQFEFDLGRATTRNAFVPRLWASRRIAYLTDQVRLLGADTGITPGTQLASANDPRTRELVDEIMRLSTEFGILTEYTSFLSREGTDLTDWNKLVLGCGDNLDNRAIATRSGLGAVNQSVNFLDRKSQTKVDYFNGFWDAQMDRVEVTTVQQICDRAFVARGNRWIDTRLVAGKQKLDADRVVTWGSPEHMALLDELISQGRQGLLSLRGEIVLRHAGENVLIRNE